MSEIETQQLDPLITEISGSKISNLIKLMTSFEDLINNKDGEWIGKVALEPNFPLIYTNQAAKKIDSLKFSKKFREFCIEYARIVEQTIGYKIKLMKQEASDDLFNRVKLIATVTMRRQEGSTTRNGDLHADSFDGTILAFALVSSRDGTVIYPYPRGRCQVSDTKESSPVSRTPLEQFERESRSGSHPARIRWSPEEFPLNHDAPREWRSQTMVILPAATPHCVPQLSAAAENGGARWFARLTLQLTGNWASAEERLSIAKLVAKHVWGDTSFAEAAESSPPIETRVM